MYKMMIVDDEYRSREGMQKLLNWEDFNIKIIGLCESAEAGLEMALEQKPDIIITDIKMRAMDGLTMLTKIKEHISCEFIVISGYSLFEYAQRAMQTGVVHYLVKPVSRSSIETAILQSIGNINRDKKQSIAEKLGNSEYILELLINENDNSNANSLLEIDHYYVALIQSNDDIIKKYQDEITLYEALFNQLGSIYIFFLSNKMLVLVTKRKIEHSDELKSAIPQQFKVGISQMHSQGKQFIHLYEEAQIALQQCIREDDQIRYFDQDTTRYITSFYRDAHNDILLLIESYEIQAAKNEIFKCFSKAQNESILYSDMNLWAKGIFYDIVAIYENENGNNATVEAIKTEFNRKINNNDFFDFGIKDTFQSLCDLFEMPEETIKKATFAQGIGEIVEYIDKHYDENLSLQKLSQMFYIESKYLSKLFKMQTGKGYMQYITQRRMETAKELLKRNDMTIYEVAKKVSYDDAKYFTALFKRYTGMVPRDFRLKKSVGSKAD